MSGLRFVRHAARTKAPVLTVNRSPTRGDPHPLPRGHASPGNSPHHRGRAPGRPHRRPGDCHRLVHGHADPRDLGLGDPRVAPRALTRSSTRAGRYSVHLRLHDDGAKGLVIRRRHSSSDRMKLPVRTVGISRSRSPAGVVRVLPQCPLRKAVREALYSFPSARMCASASASISSCSIRSTTLRTSSIPSVERSDSGGRTRSDRDRAIVHSCRLNWRFSRESCTMARSLFRERPPASGRRPGQTPRHSPTLTGYTTERDAMAATGVCRAFAAGLPFSPRRGSRRVSRVPRRSRSRSSPTGESRAGTRCCRTG
ncbi:hypothetical protein J2Z21_008859 [Streptomyces griseochromogenes]|uniref:Uncharacterized protein n=1 Tax=Streptomyces griseochromogenes TaxID=68214 RepID=A0ABS4M872_9ACTN|nr:hypothetical protein [Streptomyces griseochromogenes]